MKLLEIAKIFTKLFFPLFRKEIQTVMLDGKKSKYVYIDKGTPYTIVFENGLGTPMSFWDRTFLELSKNHSVFAYNRHDNLKIMKSEIADNSNLVVETLHHLLEVCKVKVPYILVGHSLGGIYVQHYIKQYPEDVAGLVLVDAPYPDEFADVDAMKIPPKLHKKLKIFFINVTKMGHILLSEPITKKVPMMILSALMKQELKEKPEMQDMVTFMHSKQKEYLTLYPWAKQTWVDTGHAVMYDKPEVVTEAIEELLKEK